MPNLRSIARRALDPVAPAELGALRVGAYRTAPCLFRGRPAARSVPVTTRLESIRGLPPTAVASTGSPHAIASSIVLEIPSASDGQHETDQKLRIIRATSIAIARVATRTHLFPLLRAGMRTGSRSGPSPTMTNRNRCSAPGIPCHDPATKRPRERQLVLHGPASALRLPITKCPDPEKIGVRQRDSRCSPAGWKQRGIHSVVNLGNTRGWHSDLVTQNTMPGPGTMLCTGARNGL